jgi:hypothetical protein
MLVLLKTDWGKIDIDAAIAQVRIGKRFGDIGFEIDANTIKERINPTKRVKTKPEPNRITSLIQTLRTTF